MTAAAWHVTEQRWQSILSNVSDIYIVLDGAGDAIGMDNFRIVPSLATVDSFAASFGRSNCAAGSCQDFDKDGDVDGRDLFTLFQK
jgi:hypothetical protein